MWLTKACKPLHDAAPVAIALGRCVEPAKLEEALVLFEGLGSLTRRRIMATYGKLSKDPAFNSP